MDDIKKTELIEKFKKADNKLILLDYDGTLVNYELIPEKAILSEELGDILMTLIDKPQTRSSYNYPAGIIRILTNLLITFR